MPYRFILLLIACLLPGAAKTNEPQTRNQTPATFAEVLMQLVAMSEAGGGFDSLGTGQKITAGGYKEVERVSLLLPGAEACFLSGFDKSYVAWFGHFATLPLAKTRMASLTRQVTEALGKFHRYEDDYVEPKKGTYMRFFRFETDTVRSAGLVAIELAFFDNQYQIRLSVPSVAPTYYNQCSFYVVTPSAEYDAFKDALNTLLAAVPDHFAKLRGAQVDENFTQGKIYALTTNLPGMKCVAGEQSLGIPKEYCSCLSEQSFQDFSEYNMPHTIFLEQLIYTLQSQGYVIGTASGLDQESMVLSLAKPRANGIVKEKAVCIYLKEQGGTTKIGISIRDLE
jgi:hypothetical protein